MHSPRSCLSFSLSLSSPFPQLGCVAIRCALYPPGLTSNKSCSAQFPDGLAEVHPAITIRTTRAGPPTTLARVGGNIFGGFPTSNAGQACRVPRAFLAESITINGLGPHNKAGESFFLNCKGKRIREEGKKGVGKYCRQTSALTIVLGWFYC